MVILIAIVSLVLLFEIVRFYPVLRRNKKMDALIFKKRNEIHALNQLFSLTYYTKEPVQETFPKFLNFLKETLGFTYHSIFRLDEEKQYLTIRFTGYLPNWYMEELSKELFIKVGDASVGRSVATKQPATINSTSFDPRFKSITPIAGQTGYRSLSCYPMIGKQRTLGGFCAYSAFENTFNLADVQFFTTCANFLASVLEDKLLSEVKSTEANS